MYKLTTTRPEAHASDTSHSPSASLATALRLRTGTTQPQTQASIPKLAAMSCCSRRHKNPYRLNILLTNGRFPVSIDLARQLHLLSHSVYVVDPMHYHVCRFSRAIKRSHWVPTPHIDAHGFIAAVKKVVHHASIDLIIPMHEEIFYRAESKDP
jgi:hypothetical protein